MENTFTIDTYANIELANAGSDVNELLNRMLKLDFTVPYDWAMNWICYHEWMDEDEFRGEYTYEDTAEMLCDAHADGVLIKTEITLDSYVYVDFG